MARKHTLAASFVALSFACLVSNSAYANAAEDVFGIGARSVALGGAGTATAHDFSATYYNPANLPLCKRHQLSVGVHQIFNNLGTDIDVSELPTVEDPFNPGEMVTDPELVPIEPQNQTRLHLGVCIPMPANLALGLILDMGLQNTIAADPNTVAENPRFFTYGSAMDTVTIQLALGYQPVRWLSLGLGASVLANIGVGSALAFSLSSSDPDDAAAMVRANLTPKVAPIAGIYASPIPELELGVTFRGKLFSDLNVPSVVAASSGALAIEAALVADGSVWYTPNQLAFGIAGRPFDALLLTVDVTWYQLSDHPSPYIEVIAVGEVLGNEIVFPPFEDFGFRNIVVPRFGVEYRMLANNALALRGGYMFRPWSAAIPGTSAGCQEAAQDPNAAACRANLLDNSSHWISVGAGYTVFLGHAPTGPEQDDGRPALTVDVFFRAGLFQDRQVNRTEPVSEVPYLRQYSYGGQVYDLGATLTLDWE